jgi:transcriptional regulator with XRE-family HTH domain
MANILGISARNFQRLEMGEVEPRLETLIRIADALSIQVSSLIRNTDQESLSMYDVSTYSERVRFQELDQKSHATNEDLKFIEEIIEKDRRMIPSNELEATMAGNIVTLSEKASQLFGLTSSTFDVQQYVMVGCPAERWEYAFRYNLKRAILENVYWFPNGIVMLQSYHHTMNPNPDNPTSEIYLRDISGRHNLENWLKNLKRPFVKTMDTTRLS